MKRKFAVLSVLMVFLTSCAWFQNPSGKTETIIISYETLATVAFPTVLVYLQEREMKGSLAGESLTQAKKQYAQARQLAIQAGDMLKAGISGQSSSFALVPNLLRQAAVILADLSGGKVAGETLTIPAGGGK
jgi:hypothetical protein